MITAVIAASGSGVRFGGDIPKQFVKLAGKAIVEHTLEVFDLHPSIDCIVLVAHPDWVDRCQEFASRLKKRTVVVAGGLTRMDSSYAGIMAAPDGTTHVLIHDGVRPFVRPATVSAVIDALKRYDAVNTVIPTTDTIVKVFDDVIQEIPDRAPLRRGQTPQGFDLELIRKAHGVARIDGVKDATDDCRLVLRLGKPVFCVPGEVDNIKITEEFDLFTAERYYQVRRVVITESKGSFKGKRALVIGGATGIGKAAAEVLEHAGFHVIPLSRRTRPSIDVTDDDKVRETLSYIHERNGAFYTVVNCAGVLERGYVRALAPEVLRRMVEVNLMGTISVCRHALPFMEPSGHIINIVSSSATRGRATYAAYSGSKAAVVNFTQAVAEEMPDLHINAVCPQRTATEMRFKAFGYEDPASLLSPETVARTILSVLCSDYTGQVIDVRVDAKAD
ncbi:MAG: 2-C-methyl-D-erythritol 4-phosphate cytidylyltransferase [Pseudomonadota bacterium]